MDPPPCGELGLLPVSTRVNQGVDSRGRIAFRDKLYYFADDDNIPNLTERCMVALGLTETCSELRQGKVCLELGLGDE